MYSPPVGKVTPCQHMVQSNVRMVLELTRSDYTLVGLTAPRCMKLLPQIGVKGLNKVAVGGQDGVLQVFSLKKFDVPYSFKTLPGDPISTLQLGGNIGSIQDKIFVTSKNEVRGYTKKGKVFLGFDTNMTEPITSMNVCGSDLIVSGTHSYNHYRDCKDMNSYLCSDKINDIIALPVEKTHRLVSVLACEDRVLRIIERSNVCQTFSIPSPPTTMCLFNNNGGDSGYNVVCAMQNGDIGLVQISRTEIEWKWIIPNAKRRGTVQCMYWYDICKDGVPQLIVGRDDGSIQIYGEALEAISEEEPLIEKYNYLSWFFGLTTEVLEKEVSLDNNNMSVKMAPEEKQKIEHLRAEIEAIEKNVAREREKYQLTTKEDSIGVSTIPPIKIADKLSLISEDQVFQLSLEAETAIDNVLLQSNVQIKFLDVEKNSAVVSHSVCQRKSGSRLLATYRCQVNTTKLTILFHYGSESGVLNVYITPHAKPKATYLKSYIIRQLGRLSRTHDLLDISSCNILRLKGSFSQAEMHNWISLCLPEVPEKMPSSNIVSYCYESAFVGTHLRCCYSKGDAEFKSDDITIISVLKDFLTHQATMKKIHLDITFDLNKDSVKNILQNIYPKLQKEIQEQKEKSLLEALKDIEENDGDSFVDLVPGCKRILEVKNKTQRTERIHINRLEEIKDFISSLITIWFKFQDVNIKLRADQLKEKLDDCSFDDLISYFEEQDTALFNNEAISVLS